MVDDEDVVRQLVTDMLLSLGYQVVEALDGQQAVETYKSIGEEIDLVIIDMIMPNMGGKDCFAALKALNPEVKAVLSTGYTRDGAAQEILDEGMIGFVQKPYRIQQLSVELRTALVAV